MGDWLELFTQNNLEYVFLPESSGAVKLRVKAANDAHIALTNGPFESDPMTEIIIGGWNNTKSAIRRDRRQPDKAEASTGNILNADEHVAFWIRWHDHGVSAGLKGEPAFIRYVDPDPHPITHLAVRTGSGVIGHWEIEVSPLLFRSLPVKPIEGGQLRWVAKTRDEPMPQDALIGGYENGEVLYVGRALQRRNLFITGKYVPSEQCVIVGWCRILTKFYTCEILRGYNAAWLKTSGGCIPPHAFAGGFEGDEPYFIGRARIDDNLVPGKVLCTHKLCYIPYADTEVDNSTYEILVIPDKLPRAVVWSRKTARILPPPPEVYDDDADSWYGYQEND